MVGCHLVYGEYMSLGGFPYRVIGTTLPACRGNSDFVVDFVYALRYCCSAAVYEMMDEIAILSGRLGSGRPFSLG